jgi:hypothetical protein
VAALCQKWLEKAADRRLGTARRGFAAITPYTLDFSLEKNKKAIFFVEKLHQYQEKNGQNAGMIQPVYTYYFYGAIVCE